MKNIVLSTLVLLSFNSYGGEKFVCNEYNRQTNTLTQYTVVLAQNGDEKIAEGKAIPFGLEIYKGANVEPELKTSGAALVEDVMLNFKSKDKKVEFSIFKDELDQSALTINGSKKTSYICR